MLENKEYDLKNKKLAVIGLGYVGLPLAVEFGKKRKVVGFDLSKKRINDLNNGLDLSFETNNEDLKAATNLTYTSNPNDISECEIFIVTVPTPINNKKNPDLSPLKKACELVGSVLKKEDIVIFESTVYPGATEEVCVPILEKHSGLNFNKNFYCGYSPERINPGDKKHRLTSIIKVTSGSNFEISIKVDQLYQEIITAGTYKASSIKVAEAAKVIENTQRDVNIALINEFSMIFNKLNIDTEEVLDAAGTKWNFLPFKPGLVGGHCIGIDPYYLAYKSIEIGHNPEMILAGRKINDGMSSYVSEQLKKLMKKKAIDLISAKILIMGFTFKENCPDVRNTKIADLVKSINKYNSNVDVYDPWANKDDVKKEYGIDLIDQLIEEKYDVIILAVAHNEFKNLSSNEILRLVKKNHVIYDLKYLLDIKNVSQRL